MKTDWNPITKLRKTSIGISGGVYSWKYAEVNGLTEKAMSLYYDKNPSMWIPEPIEVAMDDYGNIVYRFKQINGWYEEKKKEFVTSRGKFVSHNHGEFGGWLDTPGGTLRGNFVEVFECGNRIYAIDSLDHMGFGRVRIYTFSDDFKEEELYSENDSVLKGSTGNISFRALYSNNYAAWILVSGDYDYGCTGKIRRMREKSYFLEISEKGVTVKAEFGRDFFWVKNMVVQGNHMFLGMDKVVADVNIEDKRITAYTPVSLEAEADIRKATARLSGLAGKDGC